MKCLCNPPSVQTDNAKVGCLCDRHVLLVSHLCPLPSVDVSAHEGLCAPFVGVTVRDDAV